MTLTKDVRLGGSDGSGRGPRLRFRARVNNLLNRSLPRAYGNVLSSPLFGLPTGYNKGGGRRPRRSFSAHIVAPRRIKGNRPRTAC